MSKHGHQQQQLAAGQQAAAQAARKQLEAQLLTNRAAQRAQRVALMKQIAAERKSTVMCYATATRGTPGTQIAGDCIRLFREHLGTIGPVDQLDLFLVTRGGDTLTPLRLVSLLREYAKRVSVLVPYMAHSAGTLICLGADEIVMGAMGELGPVDPSVTNHYNPLVTAEDVPGGKLPAPRPRVPVSVEDVTSFVNFAKDRLGSDPVGLASAFGALTSSVHPLALGNIVRQHTLIRHLARSLLRLHMDSTADKAAIEAIVETLTEKLYAHNYLITRKEALGIGLKVVVPSPAVEQALWDLFKLFEGWIGIDREVDFTAFVPVGYACFDAGILESESLLHSYCYRGLVANPAPNQIDFQAQIAHWEAT